MEKGKELKREKIIFKMEIRSDYRMYIAFIQISLHKTPTKRIIFLHLQILFPENENVSDGGIFI